MEFTDEKGCYWETYAEYVTIGICGLCGCGRDDVKEDIVSIIMNTKEVEGGNPMVFRPKGMEEKYFELILHILTDKDILEHGTSVYGSWLTKKGIEIKNKLLEEVNE